MPSPPTASESASAEEDYAHYASSVNRVLDSFYLTMADAFTLAKIKLTPEIYAKILPMQVLTLVVHLGIVPTIEDASEGDGVRVGRSLISKSDRDAVLESLSSAVNLVRATSLVSNEDGSPWKEPKPPEHVERFLDKRQWKRADLIRALAKAKASATNGNEVFQQAAELAYKKFLQRLYEEPLCNLNLRIDDRTRDRLKELRDLMATELPEEFGALTVAALCWTPND
jgi:hypothetical protein